MQVTQHRWVPGSGWDAPAARADAPAPQAVLVFGDRAVLEAGAALAAVRERWPQALLAGCSSAGDIAGTELLEGGLVATAIAFAGSAVRAAHVPIDPGSGLEAGRALAGALPHDGLVHVFVLSDGLRVNGSQLARGLAEALPASVGVTGGLSADGAAFGRTVVLAGGEPRTGIASALGLYGPRLRVASGSRGGWGPFGPSRVVTRSEGNVLHDLDGDSALGIYRRYLGAYAAGLPASGLLFPLSIHTPDSDHELVRTLLGVDAEHGSMTFAGDIPTGSKARLMMANLDSLVDGAQEAAEQALGPAAAGGLALLVSCVGRKLVLGQRTEDELEAVADVLGARTTLAGFYSYGELAPFGRGQACELHNQTMTITTIGED